VFAIRDARAERLPVRIGHVGGGVAEVLGGLRRGERVVVFPPDALRSGMRVQAAK
jgi:multidrug efflux pump subunit AcrA (membrane-fusion protein)